MPAASDWMSCNWPSSGTPNPKLCCRAPAQSRAYAVTVKARVPMPRGNGCNLEEKARKPERRDFHPEAADEQWHAVGRWAELNSNQPRIRTPRTCLARAAGGAQQTPHHRGRRPHLRTGHRRQCPASRVSAAEPSPGHVRRREFRRHATRVGAARLHPRFNHRQARRCARHRTGVQRPRRRPGHAQCRAVCLARTADRHPARRA